MIPPSTESLFLRAHFTNVPTVHAGCRLAGRRLDPWRGHRTSEHVTARPMDRAGDSDGDVTSRMRLQRARRDQWWRGGVPQARPFHQFQLRPAAASFLLLARQPLPQRVNQIVVSELVLAGVAAFARMRVGGDAWDHPLSGERGYVAVLPFRFGVVAFARMRVGGDRWVHPRSGERGYVVVLPTRRVIASAIRERGKISRAAPISAADLGMSPATLEDAS